MNADEIALEVIKADVSVWLTKERDRVANMYPVKPALLLPVRVAYAHAKEILEGSRQS